MLRLRRSRLLFLTHSRYSGPDGWCERGTVHEDRDTGEAHVVTKVREVGPTSLLGGGCAPCWEVYGKPVRPEGDR